jgi:tetratricopeptide (TPR) repeat protein
VQVFRSRDFVKREEVMRKLWQLLLLLGLTVVGTVVWAQPNYLDAELCQPKIESEQRIAACTRLLNSGQVPEQYLAGVYANRAVAYSDIGALDQAIADYSAALSKATLGPSQLSGSSQLSAVYYNRGKSFFQKGMIDRAIADFNVSIQLRPNHDWAYNDRAVAYASQGRYQEARRDFEMQLTITPSNEAVRRNLDILNHQTEPPSAQLSPRENALNYVAKFANDMCKTPLTGSRFGTGISGEVNFAYGLLLKALGSIGFKVAAEKQNQQWQGPEQKDIATIVVTSNQCRLDLAKWVIDRYQ